VQILVAGLIITLAAAVVISHSFSNAAIRDARVLAGLLGRLSHGERGLPFPEQDAEEFRAISQAAGRLQETLVKEERQRRQWTQDIAHDLKTPVTALKGQIEAIMDGVFTLTPERYKTLEEEFEQIDKLVRDLSLLSRMESPEILPDFIEIDAAAFVEQLQSRFEAVAETRETKLNFEAPAGFTFGADPDLLTRAVNNLIQNALRYSPPGGTITVEAFPEGDQVALAVENRGRIPGRDLPNIFERLYRGDTGRSSRGSGLGLTIARAVAENHGGSITARNTSRGTVRFTIRFPRRPGKPPEGVENRPREL
jgi:two-component system sensor histidine kinase BaeS